MSENKIGFEFEASKLFSNLFEIYGRKYPDAIAQGVREAAQEWKLDSDNVPPKCPLKEGHLKATGRVNKVDIKSDSIECEVSYGTPGQGQGGAIYAARLHEKGKPEWNWTEPGSGPKWLEAKIAMFSKKYLKICTIVIDRIIGGGGK